MERAAMPEAAVDEDGNLKSAEDNVCDAPRLLN
jgi:hypothetical protein